MEPPSLYYRSTIGLVAVFGTKKHIYKRHRHPKLYLDLLDMYIKVLPFGRFLLVNFGTIFTHLKDPRIGFLDGTSLTLERHLEKPTTLAGE